MDLIWLIPILPGLGAAINGLVGIRSFSRQTSGAGGVRRDGGARSACRSMRSGSCSACRPRRAITS